MLEIQTNGWFMCNQQIDLLVLPESLRPQKLFIK